MDDAPCVRQSGPVQRTAHSFGRHRWFGDERYHLTSAATASGCTSTKSGNRWSAARAPLSVPAGRQPLLHHDRRSVRERHAPVWFGPSPLPGRSNGPSALHRFDGRAEAAPPLVKSVNNLGAETQSYLRRVHPVLLCGRSWPGKPWVTKLPFPVHVVERVEHAATTSAATASLLATAYHHGYFDGASSASSAASASCIEQWDTEGLAALKESGSLPDPRLTSIESSYVRAGLHADVKFHTRCILWAYPRLQLLSPGC